MAAEASTLHLQLALEPALGGKCAVGEGRPGQRLQGQGSVGAQGEEGRAHVRAGTGSEFTMSHHLPLPVGEAEPQPGAVLAGLLRADKEASRE